MRSLLLRGHEHRSLGAIEAAAEGAAAVALSRGGARKLYAHTEPNEDACALAVEGPAALVAVADGHHGAAGAELALERLAGEPARRWLEGPGPPADAAQWRMEIAELFAALDAALLQDARAAGRLPAPTTLCLAVWRPEAGRWWHASIGDSHVFEIGAVVRDLGVAAVGHEEPRFLGEGLGTARALGPVLEADTAATSGLRAVALATDGLSEPGIGVADPLDTVAAASARAARADAAGTPGLHALELARGLVEEALAAQRRQRSGDNVAAGVLWLSPPEAGAPRATGPDQPDDPARSRRSTS